MICECTTGQNFRHTFTHNLFKSLNLPTLLERYRRHGMYVRLQQRKMFSNSMKKNSVYVGYSEEFEKKKNLSHITIL